MRMDWPISTSGHKSLMLSDTGRRRQSFKAQENRQAWQLTLQLNSCMDSDHPKKANNGGEISWCNRVEARQEAKQFHKFA
jgi:hypothetical protein